MRPCSLSAVLHHSIQLCQSATSNSPHKLLSSLVRVTLNYLTPILVSKTMPALDDRAHEKPCIIIHPTSPIHCTTLQLDALLQQLCSQTFENLAEPPGCTIVDCSSLVPNAPTPALYSMWVTPVSTPSVFSLTCVGEHIRNQLVEQNKVVMSIFNDTGGYGNAGEALAAATYMVVFKWIDLEQLRCVPVNFSSREKNAIKEYLSQIQPEEKRGEKHED
jgi:hypothetical protein